MTHYIDADKLIAEIERRIEEYNIQSLRGAELADIRSFVTSLQQEQPEVELEKEIDRVFFKGDCGSQRLTHKEIAQIARHFYELGLNARKNE